MCKYKVYETLFEKQTQYFEKKQNVFVWDAPSHALSRPFTNNYSLSDVAEWLYEILAKEEIYNPIIIGQSMGGYLAQMYMELYPDKIKGFISIDSAPLQKSYMTAMEIWLLERAEPLYKIYPWKALLICGEKDKAGSAKSYNKKWHQREGLPIKWIKNAGHNSKADQPDEVNRLIEKFISEVEGK